MEYFKSKKNKVSLQDGVIIKEYTSKSNLENEYNSLMTLNGSFAPKILEKKECSLSIEYINGELLIDSYLSSSIVSIIELANELSDTIINIKTKLNGKIPNDENFRNYIVHNKKIYRIDFEETIEGTIENWLAKLMSFAVLYDVNSSIKKSFIAQTLVNIPHSKDSLIAEFEKELIFLSKRWNVEFPKNVFEEIIRIINLSPN